MGRVFFARLLAADVEDPDRRWSTRNLRAAVTVLAVLLTGLVASAVGAGWGIGVGFAAGGMAVLGAAANLWRVLTTLAAPSPDASQAETTRVARLLRRGRTITATDAALADGVARAQLRNLGLTVWTGPLAASGQLGALSLHGGAQVLGLVVLGGALTLFVGILAFTVRFRRGLLDREPGAAR